jgi:hypothetical protein
MPTRVHRPLKIIAFNANGIGRQAYEARKQLQALKTDASLFSKTHQKPHMRFYIQNSDSYWTDCEDTHKGRTDLLVKKDIPHICRDSLPLLSVEETGNWN